MEKFNPTITMMMGMCMCTCCICIDFGMSISDMFSISKAKHFAA